VAKKQKAQNLETPAAEAAAEGAETPETAAGATAPVETGMAEKLAASEEEKAKNWDLYLRTRADLENYRKRAQREKEDLGRFANENLLREMLPVLDNLERAVAHARETGGDGSLLEGVEMTLSQLRKVFERSGVTPVEAVGKPFDPSCHEAMGQLESDELPPGSVIQELQKGYLLNQRLLRPAMVMVSKAPAADTPAQNA